MTTINHAWYCMEVELPVIQHRYAGGGYPGCGGYVDALELSLPRGNRFVLHEYRHDVRGVGYRWRECRSLDELFDAFNKVMAPPAQRPAMSRWHSRPWWEAGTAGRIGGRSTENTEAAEG